jgi:hypothetical protein
MDEKTGKIYGFFQNTFDIKNFPEVKIKFENKKNYELLSMKTFSNTPMFFQSRWKNYASSKRAKIRKERERKINSIQMRK